MKKEEKLKILDSSAKLLEESAGLLGNVLKSDYDDCTEKDFLEKIFLNINVHFSTTQALLFNMMRLLAEDKDDKQS